VLTRNTAASKIEFVLTDPRHRLGRLGEDLALDHLRRQGFDLVERNHRTRYGEIDLVVFGEQTLVFVEVKARRSGGSGHPWWNLGSSKQRQVRRMAAAYLAGDTERPRSAELRFDAIGIVLDERDRLVSLDHLEGAF